MGKEKKTTKKKTKFDIVKYLPLIILGFVILLIGLSFIGNYFTIVHYEGDVKVVKDVSLFSLLFTQEAGISLEIHFLNLYLIFPLIACILLIFSKFNEKLRTISLLIFLLVAVSSIVSKDVYSTGIYYYYKTVHGVKYSFEIVDTYFPYFVPIICYFVSFVLVLFLSTKDILFDAKDITEMGVLIAAAVGLGFIKLFPMPTGGSVNLQMLPLFLLAIRRGPLKGFIAGGIVFGLITCLTDGWGFATYPFDYLVGFGSIAIFGLFSKLILPDGQTGYSLSSELFLLLAATLSTTLRFVGSTISSMVIYGYDIIGAMIYNAPYIFVSGAMALAIIMALLGPIARVNKRFPVERGY